MSTSPWLSLRRGARRFSAAWRLGQQHSTRLWSRVATAVACAVAGLLIATSAITSQGSDLRPGRNTDLVGLLRSEASRNESLSKRVVERQREVDELLATRQSTDLSKQLSTTAHHAMLDPVRGPGVTVVLDDAPSSVQPAGVDDDLLVVHQQDIQAVANALWAGGAEAMTIQGQRVMATTGIKCVGNTVVLHGVPYAPPYRVTAIGDPSRLQRAIDDDAAVRVYREYVRSYGLGWHTERMDNVTLPGYSGSTELTAGKTTG